MLGSLLVPFMQVVSIGEILWDVIGGNEFLGGAPLNLCAHLARLGRKAVMVTAVGNDERGRRAARDACALGIDTRFVHFTSHAPTGISEVVLDKEGKATHHLLRPAAYDFLALSLEERQSLAAEKPEWISFGTLAQREAGPRLLLRNLRKDNPDAQRFYDANLRTGQWTKQLVTDLLAEATAVKLNDEEAVCLAGLFDWPLRSFQQFSERAAERFQLDLVCVTRGAAGCALWREGVYVEHPGFRVNVADTVGSGDAFSAALLHGLDRGWPLADIAEFANRVGALVAARPGATPVWTEGEALALGKEA